MSGSAPNTGGRLRLVLDCSMSVERGGLVQAAAALEAAERIAPVEVYAFPAWSGDNIIYRLGPARPGVVEEACRRADHRLGTPLARVVYEAAHRVYRPGDRYRTIIVTDGECTGCGRWLERLAWEKSWVWRILLVLSRPPEWLETSKYRRESLRLLSLLEEASAPWPPPIVGFDELAQMEPGDPRLRPGLPANPAASRAWKTGFP